MEIDLSSFWETLTGLNLVRSHNPQFHWGLFTENSYGVQVNYLKKDLNYLKKDLNYLKNDPNYIKNDRKISLKKFSSTKG